MKMKRATVYIVILGLVCTALGVAVGVAAEKRYTRRHLPRMVKSQLLRRHHQGKRGSFGQEGEKQRGAHRLQRIAQELNLTAEQEAQVQAILEQSKQEVTQARDEFRTQIEQTKKQSNIQILELLDPEQQEKFQELTARKERMKERMKERTKERVGGLR